MTTITGVMPLRNATKLGYPIDLSIPSLFPICDEIIIGVDIGSEDDTFDRAVELCREAPIDATVVTTNWDLDNHGGHVGESEIAKQTQLLCDQAKGDWILSLQADEVMHELDAVSIRGAVEMAELSRTVTGLWMQRYYFYQGLHLMRDNWTFPLMRLFKRECWTTDGFSGAMQFNPVGAQGALPFDGVGIYHYSRIGDPETIARRIRNLDTFYHHPDKLAAEAEVEPYDFGLRKLDTFEKGRDEGLDTKARLVPFPLHAHPAGVLEHYLGKEPNRGGV